MDSFFCVCLRIQETKKFIEGMWWRSGYHFLFSSMFFLSPWDKSNLTTSPIVSTATIHNPSRECANSEIHSIKVLRENHHPSGTFPLKVTLTSAKLFSNFYKEGILSSVQFRSTFLIEVKIFQFRFKIPLLPPLITLFTLPDLEFVRTVGTCGPVKFFLTV